MSTRHALFGIVTLLALAGCQPTLQDGRFTCTTNGDCPTGFVCQSPAMLCYRGNGDAGVPGVDGAAPDTGSSDTGPSGSDSGGDAAVGCGPSCIQVIVLNADPTATGSIEFMDTTMTVQHVVIPPYGSTSAVIDLHNVPVGGMLSINVPPTPTLFHDVSIPAEGRYLLVLGESVSSSNVLLLPAPRTGLHSNGYVYVQLIDMIADEPGGLIATGAGRDDVHRAMPNAFDPTTMSAADLPFLPGAPGGLELALASAPGQFIGALLADRFPTTEGTYYIVVTGHVNAHLDTADGLRFIPGLPSSSALRSSPIVRFLDTTSSTVTVCDGGTRIVTLPSGSASPPSIPPASTAWALTVHTGTDCATGTTHDVSVGTVVGRTLVSITGDTATPTLWTAASISEPMPTVGSSTIVIHNGLSMTADIAGATAIPTLGTASVTNAIAPTTISLSTAAAISRTFDWTPMSRQSWVVMTEASGSTYKAYEVDSPFDAAWTVGPVTGI